MGILTGVRRSILTLRAARLDRVFEFFPKLAQPRGQLAGTMSGGEQQMLAVGRARTAVEPSSPGKTA